MVDAESKEKKALIFSDATHQFENDACYLWDLQTLMNDTR
jgi:hypothetical protein